MNHTEIYELRKMDARESYTVIKTFDRESKAIEAMERLACAGSGAWRVVRVSEVTVASVARA